MSDWFIATEGVKIVKDPLRVPETEYTRAVSAWELTGERRDTPSLPAVKAPVITTEQKEHPR